MEGKYYEDPCTGVKCKLSDTYEESDELPGATQIPSSKPASYSEDGVTQFGGSSLGFNAHDKVPFTIDPDYRDGGQVVDPNNITPESMIDAMRDGGSPGVTLQKAANNPMPGYVPPQATSGGGQVGVNPQAPVPWQYDPAQGQIEVNKEAANAAGPQPGIPSAPPEQLIRQTIPTQGQQMQPVAPAPTEQVMTPTGLPTLPPSGPASPPPFNETQGLRQRTPDSHQVPGQQSPVPTGAAVPPPQRRVMFDIPYAGQIMGMYHDIIESEHCLSLIYHSGFAGGFIYNPGIMDTPIYVTTDQGNRLLVQSMGLTFNMNGGLMITVFPILDEAAFQRMSQ